MDGGGLSRESSGTSKDLFHQNLPVKGLERETFNCCSRIRIFGMSGKFSESQQVHPALKKVAMKLENKVVLNIFFDSRFVWSLCFFHINSLVSTATPEIRHGLPPLLEFLFVSSALVSTEGSELILPSSGRLLFFSMLPEIGLFPPEKVGSSGFLDT